MSKSTLKRFFHWGPIITISIITCVTLTTLYTNSMWWPSATSFTAILHESVFLILSSLSAFNYVMATMYGPGFLPLEWKPPDMQCMEYLQFCDVCNGFKAPRSHHCRKCGRCVVKMDHHCPYLNCCVGWKNHVYFTAFLLFSVLGCIQSAYILCSSIFRGIHHSWYIYMGQPHLAFVHFSVLSLSLCIFSLGLSVGVVIAVGMLLFFQVRAIIRNRTGIEDWIMEKAKYRREGTDDEFLFPYDLGPWENIKQVCFLTSATSHEGINWAVRAGCNQFTLTIEQIAQKKEKRARTRTYIIQKSATGSWIPFWSQSLKIAINPPCTDEPRLKLGIGDIVKVTRWKRHWLFGEKLNLSLHEEDMTNDDNSASSKSSRIRGWFPRICAVELPNSDLERHVDRFDDKKSI